MNNQFRPNNIKPLKEINFETGVNHAKGMDTENSVLKNLTTLCHSLKIDIMRRVIPPYESRVGECDAIIFSDTGILLIEVKRYGGKIMNLSDKAENIKMLKGKNHESVSNPIPELNKRVDGLRTWVSNSYSWKTINFLASIGGLGETIPIYPILCFGPSTSFENNTMDEDKILLCSSRNIKVKLKNFILSKPSVPGLSKLTKTVSNNWKMQGKLTVPRIKKGFIRTVPKKTVGKVVNLYGVTKIVGKASGVIQFTYSDKITISVKGISGIVFQANSIQFEIPNKTIFFWKTGDS